jgi:isoleucyl-tRNA synthetase
MPREVPDLPDSVRVAVEDPSSPAPGADAFRWFFFASNPPWNPTRLSLTGVRTTQRELPMTLRNVHAFFTIYANIDAFSPADAACRAGRRPAAERALLDRWILSEQALATRAVTQHMDGYRLYEATRVLTDLVDALSNWYVRRSRDRFWAPGLGPDKLDAHWTLHECLEGLARLLAPFIPFASEELWQNVVRRPLGDAAPESVHLADYPEPDERLVDERLSQVMGAVREIVSLGREVRTAAKLRVRQPLAAAELVLADASLAAEVRAHEALIRDELNVRELHFAADAAVYVEYRIKPNFRALGPRVGKRMPALKAALGAADGAALLRSRDAGGSVEIEVDGERLRLGPDEIEVSLEARPGFSAANGRVGVVVLHTALDADLVEEGLYREVLSRVQAFRKELDLEYTGRIRLFVAGHADLLAAVRTRADELGRETLATEVKVGAEAPQGAQATLLSIDGRELRLGLVPV